MRYFALLSLLCLTNYVAVAQFSASQNITLAQTSIMELRFESAQTLLQVEQQANPNNPFIPYLNSNITFLAQFISNNPNTLDSSLALISNQLRAVQKCKDRKSPYYNYCLAEMNFELGALQLQDGRNWKAAWSMLEALDLIQQSANAPIDFLPQQFMNGILHVTMGSLPNRYKLIAKLMGYTGDVEKGLAEMHKSTQTEQTHYGGFKKKFVFAYAYTRSVLYETDSVNVWDLDTAYQTSPLLVYAQARLFQNQGNNEAVIDLIEQSEFEFRYPFVYVDYWLGKAKLNRLDDDANVLLIHFLQDYEGLNNIKAANRYLSWHYFLQGDEERSAAYRENVFTQGASRSGADQLALFDVRLAYNANLIKARLYFDGGYYQQALNALDIHADSLTSDDLKMEYDYRLGRVLQKLGEVEKSIHSFKRVLTYNTSAVQPYFAANAALQLGLLYEEKGQIEKSASSFKLVLSLENFPFEDGTHQKAKAGLQRLN